MLTITENDIKSITILIKEKDLATVKAILNFLKEKFTNFSIMKFRTGFIGEDILISFKVTDDFYPKVLEKFAYNDIPVIMQDKKALEYIDEKKELKRRKLKSQGWSEISVNKKTISFSELLKYSEEGKIKEVVKEAKGGVGANLDIVKRAKQMLSTTIGNAINNLLDYSEKIGKKQEVIDQLILIASDKDLRLFHKYEDMNNAGQAAIEVSTKHKKYYHNLIDIANNSKLNNIVNVKAVITYANFYNDLPDEELEKLPDIVKLLNTRWLKIAFETVQQKLSSNEIEVFNHFIDLVEEKRKSN
jgi:hypothetical protein